MKSELEDKVREEIILAAAGVFETYGFSRVSMLDISKATGKGRSTLYHYFGNKMEVLDAVAQKFNQGTLDLCKAELNREASLASNIENFHKKKLQEIKIITKKFYLVMEDLKKEPALMLDKMRILIDEEIALLNEVIGWAIERKEIAWISDEDTHFLAEMIVVSFKGFEQEIVLYNRFPNMEVKLSFLSNLFTKGLR